jgi:hypothetical protein
VEVNPEIQNVREGRNNESESLVRKERDDECRI